MFRPNIEMPGVQEDAYSSIPDKNWKWKNQAEFTGILRGEGGDPSRSHRLSRSVRRYDSRRMFPTLFTKMDRGIFSVNFSMF